MAQYRVDYTTECGSRGIWHNEQEYENIAEVSRMCRREFKDIKLMLQRTSDKQLKELLIVKITETVEGFVCADVPTLR